MHLEIEKEYKNPLMERTEIDFSISGIEITPSRKEVTKKIAALKNAKEELVVIEFLKQPFGKHSVNGRARIYNSKERLERVETDYLPKRGKKSKEAEKTEAKKSVEKTEAKAEKGKEKLEEKKEKGKGEEEKGQEKEEKTKQGEEGKGNEKE